jgi:outer membrane lipoprotein-sorting protein
MAEQILSWAAGDFDRLAKSFWLSVLQESPPTLRLNPRSAAGIERVTIVYADDATSVRSVELSGGNGDYTRIQFKNTEINRDIPPGTFTPPPPRE